MDDEWIREEARRHRQADEQRAQKDAEKRRQAEVDDATSLREHLSSLWSSFGESLRQSAESYNGEYGKQVFFVEIHPDRVSAHGERPGRSVLVELRLDLDRGSVTDRVLERSRVRGSSETSLDMPHIRATAGRYGFEWANDTGALSPQQVADVVMRAMLDSLSKV